ncbi:MAG: hypothetical protein H6703_03815 [Myxococcales bacterium]|nr:hypothetical protein [Myxococcales bacterium]
MTGSIARNDFREDHGPGFDDHSDGVVMRYGLREVARVADVPSHLVFDHDSRQLYIADTGNARVARLDTSLGQPGRRLPVIEPGTALYLAQGPIRSRRSSRTRSCCGRAGSRRTGRRSSWATTRRGGSGAVGLDGEVIDYLDTGLPEGALMGIEIGPEGALWVVDAVDDRLLRITPKPE